MQGGADQQAYDRGVSIFSPDGRLYQVEYAREAVKRGSPVVGVRVRDGVVLVAGGRVRSSLQVPESVEKIHKVDDHVGVATAGQAADARQLVDLARREAQVEGLRYGEPIGVEPLTKSVTDYVQESTQRGGTRPFGVALLIAGVDPDDGQPRLFETDPSGTPYEWEATAVGANSADIRDYLETHYDAEADLESALDLALAALAEASDGTLDPEGMGAARIDGDGYRALPQEELRSIVAEAGLLADDSEDEE